MEAEKYTLNPQMPNADASHRGTSGPWSTTHPEHHVHFKTLVLSGTY